MLRTITAAAVAAAALALAAPAAEANHPAECSWRPQPGGSNPSGGALFGFGLGGGGSSATCYVVADGVTVVSQVMEGVFVRPVPTFVADVVQFCISHSSGSSCVTYGTVQIPPQVVYDTLDSLAAQVWPVVDPPACDAFTLVFGGHGDVWLGGKRLYDCPPYGQ